MVAALAVSLGGAAVAQEPAPRPESSEAWERDVPLAEPWDPARARELRRRIEERFGQIVRAELGLDDRGMQRLHEAMRAHADRRRALARREADIHRAIARELRPGEAANQDSLNRLLGTAARVRTERAQSDEQFLRDLNFLTPVQRARFLIMLRRFEQRMAEVRERFRAGQAGRMGPGGARPRPGPGGPLPGGGPRGRP
jgi:hypothetical protein